MAELATKKKMRGGHRSHAVKLVSRARELVKGYDGTRKSAVEQAKMALADKMKTSKTLDATIQDMIGASEATAEALLEDIESSAKARADMQEAIILIDGVLATADGTLSTEASSSNTSSAMATSEPSSKARLPKLEVRKFSGKIHEWQEFWDSFRSAIHNNTQLSDVDKFSYLRGLIEGPAKATIAGFSLTAENYGAAVELVERRFCKKVAIERAHVSQLLKVLPVHGEKDVRGLRILHDTVETHYRGLCAFESRGEYVLWYCGTDPFREDSRLG